VPAPGRLNAPGSPERHEEVMASVESSGRIRRAPRDARIRASRDGRVPSQVLASPHLRRRGAGGLRHVVHRRLKAMGSSTYGAHTARTSSGRRVGRPLATSTITTTAAARAYSTCGSEPAGLYTS